MKKKIIYLYYIYYLALLFNVLMIVNLALIESINKSLTLSPISDSLHNLHLFSSALFVNRLSLLLSQIDFLLIVSFLSYFLLDYLISYSNLSYCFDVLVCFFSALINNRFVYYFGSGEGSD